VESLNSPLLAGCPEPATVPDVREVPLGQLSADSDARRMADRILAGATGSSLIALVSFQSAI
jgi:hypothetical protein